MIWVMVDDVRVPFLKRKVDDREQARLEQIPRCGCGDIRGGCRERHPCRGDGERHPARLRRPVVRRRLVVRSRFFHPFPLWHGPFTLSGINVIGGVRVVISESVTSMVAFSNLTLRATGDNRCAFALETNACVSLFLAGENTLMSVRTVRVSRSRRADPLRHPCTR